MTTLTTLNTLRTAAGMKPLKAWKESKAKLVAAIEKLTPKTNGNEVTIAQLARELGINPRVARAKCRRRRAELNAQGKAWSFPAAAREQLVKFLTA
jgi:hypothetical protein